MDQAGQNLYNETEAYAEAILFPDFAEKYDPEHRPPVWADSRNDLRESLEYFRVPKDTAYRHQGLVYGFLIDDNPGERSYIDSEVVIARVGGPAGGNPKVVRRSVVDSKDQTTSDVVVQAFLKTKQMGLSVVLILGRKCPVTPVQLADRYSVMDHFRVSYVWAEKSSRGKVFYKVRFDKVVPRKSWWTPNQPDPPLLRYPSPAAVEPACVFCNTPAPQYYAESWLCTNPSCAFFWVKADGSEAPNQLTFDRKFLKVRLPEIPWFKPGFDLVPDLISNLLTLRETGQITAALRSLWNGIVCPQCGKCNPRVYWNVWTCDNCDLEFPPDPGYVEIQSVITRATVSYVGHPMIGPEWPRDDFAYLGPVFRQHYRLERWILHENSSITLISPTAAFNEDTRGPNALWDEMLACANLGNLGLRRGFVKGDGTRTNYFFSHFGTGYDTSDVPSTPFEEAPECVLTAMSLLHHTGLTELGPLYEAPNQLSVNGYWSEMDMAWHTDGEEDIGSTISTLSLGGDAVMHIRLQTSYYRNYIDIFHQDPIMGAMDWKNLTNLRHRWEAGEIADEDYKVDPKVADKFLRRQRPQIDLPLIHGSIVIMTGTALTKYYEHFIEVKDSMRFSVTCRTIDEKARDGIDHGSRTRVRSRLAGPRFTTWRDLDRDIRDTVDDLESELSDDDDDNDDGPPSGVGKHKPGPVRHGRKGGRKSNQSSRRPSHNRTREEALSTSPAGTRKHSGDARMTWGRKDDKRLMDVVALLGNKWTEIANNFPGKSASACRLRYRTLEKNGTAKERPSTWTEKPPAREGTKSAKATPRKGRRRRGEDDSD